jgi:hypothetical protein
MTASARPDPDGRGRFRVLRSKNAGPFALTFDIVLRDEADFARLSAALTPAAVAAAYGVDPEAASAPTVIPTLRAIKLSIRRSLPAGHPGDSDCYGMNQEEPLGRLLLALLEPAP